MNDLDFDNPDKEAAVALWDQEDQDESSGSSEVDADIVEALLGFKIPDPQTQKLINKVNGEEDPTQALMDFIKEHKDALAEIKIS